MKKIIAIVSAMMIFGQVASASILGNFITSWSIDIADKVEMILNNYDVISQNCSNNAHCFNWNDISRIYLDIYKKLEKG